MCWVSSNWFGSQTQPHIRTTVDMKSRSSHSMRRPWLFMEHSHLPSQHRMLQFHHFRHWLPIFPESNVFLKQQPVWQPSKGANGRKLAQIWSCVNSQKSWNRLQQFFCPHLAWDMAHQVLTSFFGAGDLTSTCGGFPEKWVDGWWMVNILVIDDPNSTLRFFLTQQWKMDPLKMYFLLKMGIIHCYVSLPEGITWCQRFMTHGYATTCTETARDAPGTIIGWRVLLLQELHPWLDPCQGNRALQFQAKLKTNWDAYLQETNNVKGDVMPNSLIIYLW